MWPFVHEVGAQRNSCNRPAGTIEKKLFNVSGDVFSGDVTTKFIPAIKQDLCLFRFIQSTTWETEIKNIRIIIKTSEIVFKSLDPHKLNDTFLSLKNHTECTKKCGGRK